MVEERRAGGAEEAGEICPRIRLAHVGNANRFDLRPRWLDAIGPRRSAGIPQSRTQTLLEVKAAFEAAGIEFIATPDDSPGIRLVSPKSLAETRLSGARG
jgi:hypothetical protein